MALRSENRVDTMDKDIINLANLLRESGDRVLCGSSKLRLTPALLFKLNTAFSNISFLGSNGEFQVTSAHASQSSSIAYIHFLHDFVQKTVGLTISGNNDRKSNLRDIQSVDLSRFRSLRHLELRSCSLSPGQEVDQDLQGLSGVRQQLEVLVLVQLSDSDNLLWDILAGNAVAVGPEIMWLKLSQLVASYCGLRTLGQGLSLTRNLQWLDVSHNKLSDVEAVSSCLASLPNLCYLNLSFNRLTKIPVPSDGQHYPAPSNIQILLLSHNYIENLNGIQLMKGLRELNLEMNQLQDHSSLQQLRTLCQLQQLKLKGNTISYNKYHRILTSYHLPPRAVFRKHRYRRDAAKIIPFLLDGQKLNELELQAVRHGPISSTANNSDNVPADVSVESTDNLVISKRFDDKGPESSGFYGSEGERSTRKSRKVREVIIEDFDTLDELPDGNFSSRQLIDPIESSADHLLTKKQLENVKTHFKEDWLRAHAGSSVQELLGIQPPIGILGSSVTSSSGPLSNSTPLGGSPCLQKAAPYPGYLDEQQFLESIILSRTPDNRDLTGASQSTEYHTANDSDTALQTFIEDNKTLLEENQEPLFQKDGYDGDEDEDVEDSTPPKDNKCEELGDGDRFKYLVTKIISSQKSPRDLFLVTNSRYIQEVDPMSGAVIQHWRLRSLESCVLLSAVPCQVELSFKTVVPSKKERIYEMDLDEAQKHLIPSLKAILENQTLSALNVAAFQCMHCSGQFSVEITSRKASKVCPSCGSTLVFEIDETPLPSLGSSSAASPKPQLTEATLNALDPSSELIHSPSDSSIGSAVSLESPSSVIQSVADYVPTANSGMRRCESDIDIISNPSQSSIEILDDICRTSGTPGRKRSSEERQVVAIPSLVTVPEISNPLSPVPAGLTESSSSGSITDSVCTAYENNTGTGGTSMRLGAHGLAKSVLKEEYSRENSPHYQESSRNVEPITSNVLDNLLQTMSSKISTSEALKNNSKLKNSVSTNTIQYNYGNFSTVDHRLKLHLHLSILDADEHEGIQWLLRGEVLTIVPENRYPGILLISSQNLYVLKITGPEVGDDIDRWISRVIALPLKKLQSVTALPWSSGILLTLQDTPLKSLVVIVRDQQYVRNLFSFLSLQQDKPSWKIVDSPTEQHSLVVTKILQDFIGNAIPGADLSIKLAILLSSSTVSKDNENQNYSDSSLLVTPTSLLLNSDNMKWLLPPESSPSTGLALKCVGRHAISNLIQVESDGMELWLQFLDEVAGDEETWKLAVESVKALDQIIAAIRAPWEELFSVPLQVLPVNKT